MEGTSEAELWEMLLKMEKVFDKATKRIATQRLKYEEMKSQRIKKIEDEKNKNSAATEEGNEEDGSATKEKGGLVEEEAETETMEEQEKVAEKERKSEEIKEEKEGNAEEAVTTDSFMVEAAVTALLKPTSTDPVEENRRAGHGEKLLHMHKEKEQKSQQNLKQVGQLIGKRNQAQRLSFNGYNWGKPKTWFDISNYKEIEFYLLPNEAIAFCNRPCNAATQRGRVIESFMGGSINAICNVFSRPKFWQYRSVFYCHPHVAVLENGGSHVVVSCLSRSLQTKQWDPGGIILKVTLHLEDKVNVLGAGIDRNVFS